jgi:predicted O-methyltransferase YrrM
MEEHGRHHDAQERQHSRRLLNLEPQTAQLLSILVRSSGRRRVLEIGTSNGYSTIWLAWAAGPRGRVISIERDAHKQEQADANLRRAGLRDAVDLLLGEATPIVATLAGPFDCVFFDADRCSAPEQMAALLPKLAPDAFLLADNVLSHPDELAGYLAALEGLPDFDRVVVPVGKGLSVAYRKLDSVSGTWTPGA